MRIDPTSLTAMVQDPRSLDQSTEAAWRSTLLTQAERTPFLGPTFARAVANCRGNARVCVIRSAGKPVGFFPFQFSSEWKRALGTADRIGGDLADYSGVVGEPGLRLSPADLLRLAGLNVYNVSHLSQAQQQFGLAGEAPRIGLRIDLPDGPAMYWKERTKAELSRVRDTERCRRKLEQDLGRIRFSLQADKASELLDELIATKRAQYERTATDDPLADPRAQSILHNLLATRETDCEGYMSTLHAGETWAASHFGIRCGDTFHYWFPVYNPSLGKYSPGRLLLLEIIQATVEMGVRTIDMGEGDSPSKRFFATPEYPMYRGRWCRPGLKTFVNQIDDSIRWRIQQKRSGDAARASEATAPARQQDHPAAKSA